MTTPNGYRQYRTTQVQTAGPAQLTLMCYDGAARFLLQAREAMETRRYDAQNTAIGKAQALLTELIKGLDFERGGEIARNLETLYHYLYDRLSHANIRDDRQALDEVRGHLSELRDAWAQALEQAPEAAAGEGAPRRELALSA